MEDLTKRQDEILTYIKEYIVKSGYPPTVREIAEAIGVNSPATIHAHLENLETKGFIRKQDTKNRAIELLVKNEFIKQNENVVDVALLGKVTAGDPIEAIENPDEYFRCRLT
jgi:repressor LexA